MTERTEGATAAPGEAGAAADRAAPSTARRPVTLMHRVEYALVRTLAFVFRRFPPEVASATMGALFGTLMPLTGRHQRALDHLAHALPETPEAERRRIARAMWWHFGRVFGEAFVIDRLIADPSRVSFPPEFERLREAGRNGAISAALHLGNWEIAGVIPRRAGVPLAGVYQALHNPLADAYLRRMRASAYPAGLYPKGPDLGRTLIRLARGGAAIGIVSDLREKRGIGVTFFGHPAYATPLPALLARTARRPIIAGAVIRTRGVHFRAVMEVVEVPVTDDRDRDVAVATQALHDVFERWIREAPEQWLWTHRKWARSGGRPLVVGAPRRNRHGARRPPAPPVDEAAAPAGETASARRR